jgi:hypothetical protein
MVWRGPRTVRILVPAKDISTYHIVEATDLTVKQIPSNEAKPDVLFSQEDLVSCYARLPLKAGQPVTKDQVGFVQDRRLIVNTLVVNIPASRLQFASDIQPGEVVSLTAISKKPENAPVLVLTEALVLDVSHRGNDSIVTLAVPVTEWTNYLAKTWDAQLMLNKLVK